MTTKYYNPTPNTAHTLAYSVTPHDTNEIGTYETRGIYIGGAGSGALVCRLKEMTADITFVGLTANTILPLNVTHVRLTGTNVTGIIALV